MHYRKKQHWQHNAFTIQVTLTLDVSNAIRYHSFMETREKELNDYLYGGLYPKGYPTGLEKILKRKLQILKAAYDLQDLKAPPGNQLEPLKGNLLGYWSIRVNKQYRLIFKWNDNTKEAYDVYFDDYHR